MEKTEKYNSKINVVPIMDNRCQYMQINMFIYAACSLLQDILT